MNSMENAKNKSARNLANSAVNVTLPAFAAERRAAAPGDRRFRSISPARTALSSKPAARRCCGRMGQTDGQTDARPLHRPCSAHCAGNANK